jgi:hypothetical protein
MSTQYDLFPFTLTQISPLDPDIDVITFVYDIGQIPPDPIFDPEVEPDTNFSYTDGNLTRADFSNGEYKTYTYIDNPGESDDDLLNTIYDSETDTTKTHHYNTNGVLISITVA